MANRFLSNIRINDAYTLPASDGTIGQAITTDGAGNLVFSTIDASGVLPVGLEKDLLVYNTTTATWEPSKIISSIQFEGGVGDAGTVSWNTEDETLDVIVSPSVTYQLGQELGHIARNLSGQTLNNGDVVKVTGASGNKITVEIADSTTEQDSSSTFAVVTEEINNNSTGRVTTEGLVRGLNTIAFQEGVALWLGSNGAFTDVKPLSPNHLVHIGWVVRSHETEGSILVRVSNGYEIEELHDVLISSVSEKDILAYNSTIGVWENTKQLDTLNINSLQANENIDTPIVHSGIVATPKVISQDAVIQDDHNAFVMSPVTINAIVTVGNNSDFKIIDL